MTHCMHLSESAFNAIYHGTKRVEVRLSDEKRRAVKKGDEIIFSCPTLGSFSARVVNNRTFASFAELFEFYPPERLGYAKGERARPSDMYRYYSAAQEQTFGVAAIEIELPDDYGLQGRENLRQNN